MLLKGAVRLYYCCWLCLVFADFTRITIMYYTEDKYSDWRVHVMAVLTVLMSLKADFQSVLRTLESLFTTFVLFHVRRYKM